MKAKYSLLYVDPPWSYGNTISNGAAADHYSTMKLIDIKRLPVWELAAENSVLAMWYTGTHNQEAIELAEAWGFTVRTMKGFTWVKLNQNAELRINKALAEGEVTDFYDFLDLLNAETRMNGGWKWQLVREWHDQELWDYCFEQDRECLENLNYDLGLLR